jgi:hypothetical protein
MIRFISVVDFNSFEGLFILSSIGIDGYYPYEISVLICSLEYLLTTDFDHLTPGVKVSTYSLYAG